MDQAAEVAALKALYKTYIDAWNRRDIDTYCSLFAFPMIVGGGGRDPETFTDRDAWRLRTASNLDALTARGWSISTIGAVHVGLMAGETGVITVDCERLGADGARIEGGTSNYLTRRIDGAWKIVGVIAP